MSNDMINNLKGIMDGKEISINYEIIWETGKQEPSVKIYSSEVINKDIIISYSAMKLMMEQFDDPKGSNIKPF